jgi:hypothetical protein
MDHGGQLCPEDRRVERTEGNEGGGVDLEHRDVVGHRGGVEQGGGVVGYWESVDSTVEQSRGTVVDTVDWNISSVDTLWGVVSEGGESCVWTAKCQRQQEECNNLHDPGVTTAQE